MIPDRILDAAADHGWVARPRGKFRFTLSRGDISVEGSRNLDRHTQARAYRGDALMAIFRSQREIIDFLGASA